MKTHIGIGLPITEEPSHTTRRTDRVPKAVRLIAFHRGESPVTIDPQVLSHLVSSGYIMPSADFFHAVRTGYPALSQFPSHSTFHGTWKTSRGKHMSFNTWAPSIRTELIMDRGLCLVLQARPTHARLTRFLFVTPYFRGTLPQQGYCLPKYRHRYPVVIPLHPSPPSGWV